MAQRRTLRKWMIVWALSLFLFAFQTATSIVLADDASDVLMLVNQQRTSRGLAPLVLCKRLNTAAQNHTDDMIARQFFDHVNPDGDDPGDRVTATGYNWTTVAENIAVGYPTPQAVVNGWMGSPLHRANILNPNVKHMGLGAATGNYMGFNSKYWTEVFAAGGVCGIILNDLLTPLTDTTPTFSWSLETSAAGYDIQIGSTDPPTSTVIRITTTSFVPSVPMIPGLYYWRVRPVNGGGVPLDPYSAPGSFTLTSPDGDAPVLNYYKTQPIALSWNRVSNASVYDLEVANNTDFSSPVVQITLSALSYSVSGLPEGTYFWHVRTRNGSTSGTWSATQNFTYKP